ncbi:hypothetical protein OB955_17340 [Halobacteria archaeon AArc-m2/3/4]|uniref:DUF8135 domain-containing protein n=1 Tax=Natronoglomus mannanivorans TaxID=2979990 RepID=A0ABT2QHT1_9EURY|nr:hypothetical protein [Halobacteria archaeon AArc-m2/3/4]
MSDDCNSNLDDEPDRPATTEAADTVVSYDESDEPAGGQPADRTEAPLGELAAAVGTRGSDSPRSDVDARIHDRTDGAALFEHEDVEGIDRDALWERVQHGENDTVDEQSRADTDREIREVQKRDYCHGCEHFENPPHVGCRHEGTDILEFPTLETVRVADCPVVLEEETLEDRR